MFVLAEMRRYVAGKCSNEMLFVLIVVPLMMFFYVFLPYFDSLNVYLKQNFVNIIPIVRMAIRVNSRMEFINFEKRFVFVSFDFLVRFFRKVPFPGS